MKHHKLHYHLFPGLIVKIIIVFISGKSKRRKYEYIIYSNSIENVFMNAAQYYFKRIREFE